MPNTRLPIKTAGFVLFHHLLLAFNIRYLAFLLSSFLLLSLLLSVLFSFFVSFFFQIVSFVILSHIVPLPPHFHGLLLYGIQHSVADPDGPFHSFAAPVLPYPHSLWHLHFFISVFCILYFQERHSLLFFFVRSTWQRGSTEHYIHFNTVVALLLHQQRGAQQCRQCPTYSDCPHWR